MLALTKPEIETATSLLGQTKQNIYNLFPRLQSGLLATTDVVEIELSENEVEIILDCLPMPKVGEFPQITSLRSKLTQFLANFRHKE